MRISSFGYALTIGAAAALLAGCGGAGGTTSPAIPLAKAQRAASPIKHVVIIIQMDRSMNNLFFGYPGAGTVKFGYDNKGQKIPIQPVSLATKWALFANPEAACNGSGEVHGTKCRMNGFDKEGWTCKQHGVPECPIKYPPYAYVPHAQIQPYFDMAHQYVLAAQMFASNFDAGFFESLQYIIEAQDHDVTGAPSGLWGCGGGPNDWIKMIYGGRIHPCFNNTTLGDELDAASLPWAYYVDNRSTDGICGNGSYGDDIRKRRTSIWNAYWAIKHICYGPDWNGDIISPPTQFLTDVANGELRTVSWVTPAAVNSDLAGTDSDTGPSWVASLVNAVGESKYWDSTAIFIFWDSYGGWYDPAAPPYVDADGLGFRVPMLIISPYAKQGYVSHVHYEHGSILKFTEDQFGLARLGVSDTRATSPAPDAFDFNQAPRKFIPIKTR